MTTLEGVDPKMIANNLKPYQPTHPGEVLNGKRALNTELAMLMAERNEPFMEKLRQIKRIAATFFV
jgi:hypothetical protein